jgi:peptidylprolyl isomerase
MSFRSHIAGSHSAGFRFLFMLLAAIFALGANPLRAAKQPTWRTVDPENTVFMQLRDGLVVIELNPVFAPETVKQFKRLAEERFYDGLSFYRVIDGFVAQGGDGSDLGELSNVPLIDAEFEISWDEEFEYIKAQSPDMFAPETGFIDGFAVARDSSTGKAWLTHCPGIVAMARNDDADSSRTDFYIVIGQAPRYLDRNMNVFARVVYGMDVVQRIRRGPALDNGIIHDDMASTRISKLRLAADIPEDELLKAYVLDTNSKGFKSLLKNRRNRKQKFFHNKPVKVLDVCQVPVAGRITK